MSLRDLFSSLRTGELPPIDDALAENRDENVAYAERIVKLRRQIEVLRADLAQRDRIVAEALRHEQLAQQAAARSLRDVEDVLGLRAGNDVITQLERRRRGDET